MSITLFLPVRSGSERIKNKNTRPFANFQNGILELKLNQIESLTGVDEIIVSSNDLKCLEIAETYKTKIQNLIIDHRPEVLGLSSTKLEDLILYAGKLSSCDDILWTHATNPLFNTEDYEKAIKVYLNQKQLGFDSLVSGAIIKEFLLDMQSNKIINNKTKVRWPRTQDLDEIFSINNAVFMADKNCYERADRLGDRPYFLECTKISSLDIDYEEDFLISEAVYEKLRK